MMRAATTVLALAVLLAGCSLLGLDGDPPLDGRWVGTVSDSTDASVEVVTVTLDLSDASGTITGTMQLAVDAFAILGSVSGSYSHPDVQLTMTATFEGESATMSYVGKRTTDDQIDGTMTAAGDSRSLALRRQR